VGICSKLKGGQAVEHYGPPAGIHGINLLFSELRFGKDHSEGCLVQKWQANLLEISKGRKICNFSLESLFQLANPWQFSHVLHENK